MQQHSGSRSIFRRGLTLSLSLLVVLAVASRVSSQTPWPHPDGTAHWYEVVDLDHPVDWQTAQSIALSRGGHLATITSASENAFVFGLADAAGFWTSSGSTMVGPWIGGVWDNGSWRWVRGEAFGYTNWAPGQPSGINGSEDRIHYGGVDSQRTAHWDDRLQSQALPETFVIEWEWAPDQTLGHFQTKAASFGDSTIFGSGGMTFLVDQQGRVVHFWSTAWANGFAPYLQPNGDLLRLMGIGQTGWAGGHAGRVEQHDWNGNLVWDYDYFGPNHISHHDIELLPNGNLLILAWERKTAADAIAAGRDPNLIAQGELWPEHIIEVQPSFPSGGVVVWEWHLWDHLVQDFDPTKANFGVVANHPELVDINYHHDDIADWCHANSLDYNAQLDQIVISVRHFNEIWVIDHSTTTAEAASHSGGQSGSGGDLLYRWGNPRTYGAGTVADQQLFGQHDATWIESGLPGAGDIMIFNNGTDRLTTADHSSVEEITPPLNAQGVYDLTAGSAYAPAAPTQSYRAVNPTDFFSRFVSGSQRLPNGNTLICAGAIGEIFEVTPSGEIVWKFVNGHTQSAGFLAQGGSIPTCGPGLCNAMFRAYRHPANHPGLAGQNLAPLAPLETYGPEMLARVGTVNFGLQSPADVLRVNGSTGDVWRELYTFASQPLTITMDAPPAGPAAAGYALYAVPIEVGVPDLTLQPFGIGTAVMPLPLSSGIPTFPLVALANSIGFEAILGLPALPGAAPAPTTIFNGTIPTGTYSLQGYIIDQGSAVPSMVSLTNAVVIHVL